MNETCYTGSKYSIMLTIRYNCQHRNYYFNKLEHYSFYSYYYSLNQPFQNYVLRFNNKIIEHTHRYYPHAQALSASTATQNLTICTNHNLRAINLIDFLHLSIFFISGTSCPITKPRNRIGLSNLQMLIFSKQHSLHLQHPLPQLKLSWLL